jgi:checkpoint serine/threonine-protein kinase
MSASNDLINFDVIETQKENIQSLPGGRSAKALAQIFSAGSNGDKYNTPSPNDTRTLNDAIRQEYEAELEASADSDDPLDAYDRYVKWALDAYPSSQATAESGLLPLLERATKAFLTSTHYKNDPRYLRLWLQYIRLFSDTPRETFSFLARHHVGEGLALFYEEFASWLEGAGRWTQAEEVYKLGIEREARPQERLLRRFGEFQARFERQPQGGDGPSSPALPTVRPALAAKVDPFVTARTDPQAPQARGVGGGRTATKSGKQKLAIFSDSVNPDSSQPPTSSLSKGWDNIGSLRDRRKENEVEAKPWAGETLKSEKKPVPVQKMAVFRDEVSSKKNLFLSGFHIFTITGLIAGMALTCLRFFVSSRTQMHKLNQMSNMRPPNIT